MTKLSKKFNIEISFISLLTACILVLSVAYDYGFNVYMGISFAELPTTLSDHIRSSLTWFPTAIFILFSAFIINLFFKRTEQGLSEEELIASSSYPKFTKYTREISGYLFIVFTIITPILLVYFNKRVLISQWIGFGITLWILFMIFILKNPRIMENSKFETKLLLLLLPPVIFLFIGFGMISAQTIKEENKTMYSFQFDDNTTCEGVLARSYEKVYFLWDKEKQKIKFIKADKVISITPIETNN